MRIAFCALPVLAPVLGFSTSVLAADLPVAAPQAAAPAVVAPPALQTIVLPPNSEVVVTSNDTLTTKGKAIKQGSKFRMATMFDVMQDGFVVIPKGTVGEGTVTYITNKGAFGKSGKMEVSMDWLDIGGRHIPLTGSYRQEGEGNTGATVATAVAVGVFSAFVTGRSATIVNGQQMRAHTVEPLSFTIPANAPRMVSGTLAPAPQAAPAAPAPAATPAS